MDNVAVQVGFCQKRDMALRADRLIQEHNLKVHYNGVSVGGQKNASKAPKKGLETAGRKPLGDLSNSVNPLPNQASKKQNTKVFSVADKDTTTTSKIQYDANKGKSVSNASERVHIGARKVLSDISNSTKPYVRETTEKNRNAKQSIVIEEECFLHNHQECIKAQKPSMHMNEFLQMVGLDKDFSEQSALLRTPPMSNKSYKTKPNCPLNNSKPVEMAELLIEDQSPSKHNLYSKLVSPSATRTPERPNHIWADHDCVSYRLIETPELPKH